MDGRCQHRDLWVMLPAKGSQAHFGTTDRCVQGILVYLANEIANHRKKKAEWAERKNILWPETCWTLKARDQRLCRGGEGCSLACPRHINHHREDIPKANYVECFLGKSSPRPCKSSPALAGIQICLGVGWGVGGVPVHPSVRWRNYTGMPMWSLVPDVFSPVIFIQGSSVEQNYLLCLRILGLGLTTRFFHLTCSVTFSTK